MAEKGFHPLAAVLQEQVFLLLGVAFGNESQVDTLAAVTSLLHIFPCGSLRRGDRADEDVQRVHSVCEAATGFSVNIREGDGYVDGFPWHGQ